MRMLGREPVTDRQDRAARRAHEIDVARRIAFGQAHHETAAVDVQQ